MASVVCISSITPKQTLCSRSAIEMSTSITLCFGRTSSRFMIINKMEKLKHSICKDHRVESLHSVKKMAFMGYKSLMYNPLSPSQVVEELYKCINDKNLKHLSPYISTDCYIEECSFPNPFQGKKVKTYLCLVSHVPSLTLDSKVYICLFHYLF